METPSLSVKLILETFNLQATLDVLLIALGLFFLYRTLLRLGSWKIVAGIFLAWAFFGAANILHLRGISWIYSNLSQVAVIALIVLFQPELRKVLEKAASLRPQEMGKGTSELSVLVSNSLFALVEQRSGAIIVFPGKEPLQRWLTGGVSVNASVSFPLIMSIFDPHSPGHDGAVIIEKGMITHLGMRLPISKTDKLGEEFGTRHHSAMGLCEVSDALVAVVSEERGVVTLFHAGSHQQVNDKDVVAARILSHWKKATSYASEMRQVEKKRTLIKEAAVSLVLAFVFWFTVAISMGEIRERGFTIPIEYINTPTQLALLGDKPSETKLQLAGPKSDLDLINPAHLSVKINLSSAKPGSQTFMVTQENLKLPKRVRLLDAEPSTLTLTLVEIVERDVLVKPQLVGELPQGWKLESVKVLPKQVRVLSPTGEGQVQDLVVTTTPIYLENIRGNSSIYLKIIAPPSVQPADKRWPDVEVRIAVTPE